MKLSKRTLLALIDHALRDDPHSRGRLLDLKKELLVEAEEMWRCPCGNTWENNILICPNCGRGMDDE